MIQKHFISLAFVLLVASVSLFAEEEEKYSSKYDDIDVDAILTNPKLRNQYFNCYMDTGACVTADSKYFKELFPEAFTTNCRKCTEKQIQFFDKVTAWYTENEPDTWKQVVEKTVQDIQKQSA